MLDHPNYSTACKLMTGYLYQMIFKPIYGKYNFFIISFLGNKKGRRFDNWTGQMKLQWQCQSASVQVMVNGNFHQSARQLVQVGLFPLPVCAYPDAFTFFACVQWHCCEYIYGKLFDLIIVNYTLALVFVNFCRFMQINCVKSLLILQWFDFKIIY